MSSTTNVNTNMNANNAAPPMDTTANLGPNCSTGTTNGSGIGINLAGVTVPNTGNSAATIKKY